MLTKELACRALIAAEWNEAFDVGETIARKLRGEGNRSSLEHELCLKAFVVEWFFARIMWLQSQAIDIRDVELENVFMAEIDSKTAELLQLVPDLADVRENYLAMAMMRQKGERDSFGLLFGPGPTIALRYSTHVRAMGVHDSASQPLPEAGASEAEVTLIGVLGDRLCWSQEWDLNAVLHSMSAS